MWIDEFEFPDGSYSESDIQVYIEYIIKKNKTLTSISPIHVCINRINNRLVFKIKDGYKFELQTSETMQLFASTKKVIEKKKMGKMCRVLKQFKQFQSNVISVDNQYQQKSEVLYTFTPNKFHAYLLNVEPGNLVFLKTYKTAFDEIIKTFTDQNGRPLERQDKVDLTLPVNKQK